MYLQHLRAAAVITCLALIATVEAGLTQPTGGTTIVIPKNASGLEGVPTVRLDVTPDGARRHQLDRDRAASEALKIGIVDGKYYWTNRENRPLTLTTAGDFTYLTSEDPGQYVRFKKINDKLWYVEHVDMEFESVTYWGELRVVVGNK